MVEFACIFLILLFKTHFTKEEGEKKTPTDVAINFQWFSMKIAYHIELTIFFIADSKIEIGETQWQNWRFYGELLEKPTIAYTVCNM